LAMTCKYDLRQATDHAIGHLARTGSEIRKKRDKT